jgi:flagellar basal body-associated protein FliL
MFCPNCGKADQTINSYCRQCGEFLPDFNAKNKTAFGGSTPEEQIKMNLTLSLMSAIVSFILALMLYVSFFKRTDTPVIIYIVAAFLLTICGWQASTFAIGLKLKKHFQKRRNENQPETIQAEQAQLPTPATKDLLPEANFENIVPESVTEHTTRKLKTENRRIDRG